MAYPVIMPELGESVDEATLTLWLKKEGEPVREFEPLLEVNTDKVDTEIPSPASGVLLKILVGPETVIQAGMTLAWIGQSGESLPPGSASTVEKGANAIEAEAVTASSALVQSAPKAPELYASRVRPGMDDRLGFISPVVARMASEHGLDLTKVKGSGKEGRITKVDVQNYLSAKPAPSEQPKVSQPVSPQSGQPTAVAGEVLKLTTIRKTIAEHMVRSKQTSPHVSTVMEADLSRVVPHRLANKDAYKRDGANLTFTPYFIFAAVTALKQFPIVNSSWSEEGILLHKPINVGMATALETDGLIVPVIKNADSLSLLGLTRSVNDLAQRARLKQLHPEEVRGGTFTITNHGTSGSLFATPIINQPQCAILGVGAIQKRAVVIDDAIAIRSMVYISLTFDHRILDGASADYFLGAIKRTLETWAA